MQEVRFAEKLAEIVRSMPRLSELLGHTRALGARHAGYGVRAADYRTVGDALLAALAAVLGDSFDAPAREAWDIAYNLVAETMLEGAASASATARSAAIVACTPSDLRVSLNGAASEGQNDVGTTLDLTNSSRHACALDG